MDYPCNHLFLTLLAETIQEKGKNQYSCVRSCLVSTVSRHVRFTQEEHVHINQPALPPFCLSSPDRIRYQVGSPLSDGDWRLAGLCIGSGRIGARSAQESAPAAHVASSSATSKLPVPIWPAFDEYNFDSGCRRTRSSIYALSFRLVQISRATLSQPLPRRSPPSSRLALTAGSWPMISF